MTPACNRPSDIYNRIYTTGKNGKARMKTSKGSIHSRKARVVYTSQTGTARQPLMVYTTQFTLTLPKVKITLADFHPCLAVLPCSVNRVYIRTGFEKKVTGSSNFPPGCSFLPVRCFIFVKHAQMIYAG